MSGHSSELWLSSVTLRLQIPCRCTYKCLLYLFALISTIEESKMTARPNSVVMNLILQKPQDHNRPSLYACTHAHIFTFKHVLKSILVISFWWFCISLPYYLTIS